MIESNSRNKRIKELTSASRQSHQGIYLTGPNQIKILVDRLPIEKLKGDNYLLASLGNCRCASDAKAIRQFDQHARVPSGIGQIALGHETLQIVLEAPAGSDVFPGDVVVITPGHATEPIDPLTYLPNEEGVLASLGYSYRYLGGLRQFNLVPGRAPEFVKEQGFGNLFNKVAPQKNTSMVTLAHAEPFACNYGTNKHIFTLGDNDEFHYGVPPRAVVTYLSGTARMAMINLTIVASVKDEFLPRVVYITGSKEKLDEMEHYALVQDLRDRGTKVVLVDRKDPDILDKLLEYGRSDVVWTNYASEQTYRQASAIMADGGNLNNYAGAVDPDLSLKMPIGKAISYPSFESEATAQIQQMHHNLSPNDPSRYRGLSRQAKVLMLGFEPSSERASAYLNQIPRITPVASDFRFEQNTSHPQASIEEGGFTDVFIAGTGIEAADRYSKIENKLARSAAVNFVDGEVTIPIRSKNIHYVSRHQICGKNVPWHLTNTSEPHSDDMLVQAANPVSFDWMVKGVCGLKAVPEMMKKVEQKQPFGSFFAFTELTNLPFVEANSNSFREAARHEQGPCKRALNEAGEALANNNNVWCREVEKTLYLGFDIPYPLDLE